MNPKRRRTALGLFRPPSFFKKFICCQRCNGRAAGKETG
jgi:hypothetical protein